MTAGESLVRQLLYGQRCFAARFGASHTVAWLPDCFGLTPAFPQLLRRAGIERFFTMKLTWSETNRFPYDLFWWEGLDGSRVLAHMFDNPEDGYNARAGPRATLEIWRRFRGKGAHVETLLCVGYGDGGGAPTDDMVERVAVLERSPRSPISGSAASMPSSTASTARSSRCGRASCSSSCTGTLTTQGRTKRAHRRAERDLVAAEALGALEALAGGEIPASLEAAWRVLLRNQFHDVLPGSSIREVHEQAEAELADVSRTADGAIDAALGPLAARLDGEGAGILVVNPELTPRPVRVLLPDGPLTAAGTIDGLEARVIVPGDPAGPVSATERVLENDLVRVELARDGTLASVLDKRLGRELLDDRGNQLWAYVDKPREWDAWDIEATYAEDGAEISAESVRLVEHGPHRTALRVERRFRDSRIVQDVRLWAGSARIDFATRLDWHDRRWLLKARFPLAVRRAGRHVRDGVRRRRAPDAPQHVVGPRAVRGRRPPLRRTRRAELRRRAAQRRSLRAPRAWLRARHQPPPLAGLARPAGRRGRAGGRLCADAAPRHVARGRPGRRRGPQPPAAGARRRARRRRVSAAAAHRRPARRARRAEAARGWRRPAPARLRAPQGAHGRARRSLPDGWTADAGLDLLERETGDPDLAYGPFAVRTWRLSRA